MASLSSVKFVWENLTELDLAPLRDEALQDVNIALAGTPGSGRSDLADHMRRDPANPRMVSHTPVMLVDLEETESLPGIDLVIIIVNPDKGNGSQHRDIADRLLNRGQKVLIFINNYANMEHPSLLEPWKVWDTRAIVYGNVNNVQTLHDSFVPAVVAMLPEILPALARSFPLFRVQVANKLINETCISNSAYSFSTGLAEMIPMLGIPLTVADIFVLTKMQAFMVYKVGLALGLSTNWQDYVVEFGGVLGGGFLWRQAARSLVGLIPVYGIIPKVAIAYAGTYVVGHVILRWYLTGKHLSRAEMGALFKEAMLKGREAAGRITRRKPKSTQTNKKIRPPRVKLRLPGRRKRDPSEADTREDLDQ